MARAHRRASSAGARSLAPGIGFAYLTLLATVAYSLADKQAMARLSAAPWTGPLPRSIVYFFLITAANALFFVPLALRRVSRAAVSRGGARRVAHALRRGR